MYNLFSLINVLAGLQWRSQKFSTGGALISGFPSYPHTPLLIYLILYVTKYFSEK